MKTAGRSRALGSVIDRPPDAAVRSIARSERSARCTGAGGRSAILAFVVIGLVATAAEAQEATSRPASAEVRTYEIEILLKHRRPGMVRVDTAAPRPPRPATTSRKAPPRSEMEELQDHVKDLKEHLRPPWEREGNGRWSNIPAPLPGMPTRLLIDYGEFYETIDVEFLSEELGYAPIGVRMWPRRAFLKRVVRVGSAPSLTGPVKQRPWWLRVEEVTMRGAEWCRWIGLAENVSNDDLVHDFRLPRTIVRLVGTPVEGSWSGRVDLGLIDAREVSPAEIPATIPSHRMIPVELVDETGRPIKTPLIETAFSPPLWRVEEPGATRPTLLGDLTASDGRRLLVFTPTSPAWRLHVELPGFEPLTTTLPPVSEVEETPLRVTLRRASEPERAPISESRLDVYPVRSPRYYDIGPWVTVVLSGGRTRVEPDVTENSKPLISFRRRTAEAVFHRMPTGPARVLRAVVLRRPSFRGGAPSDALRAWSYENLVLLSGPIEVILQADKPSTVDLNPPIGLLRLRAEGDAESVEVLIEAVDGRSLALDALGRPISVLRAGIHRLTTTIPLGVGDYRISVADPAFQPWTTQLHIAEGSFAAAAVPVRRAF